MEKISKLVIVIIILLITVGFAQGYLSGIVSYWALDEGSGNVAGDSVGNNYGLIFGASWTDGVCGNALFFDGDDDFIKVDDDDDWNFGTDDFTISFWAKFNNLPIVGADMEFIGQGETDWSFSLRNQQAVGDLVPGYYIRYYPGNGRSTLMSVDPIENQWQHWVFMGIGGEVTVYIDGEESAKMSVTIPNSPKELEIGGSDAVGLVGDFDGVLDEVVIYDGSFSVDELGDLQRCPSSDDDRGHGNDADGVDEDNPGQGCEKKNEKGNKERCSS